MRCRGVVVVVGVAVVSLSLGLLMGYVLRRRNEVQMMIYWLAGLGSGIER